MEKTIKEFPEEDETVIKYQVFKLITFAKIKNLNNMFSHFTVE